MISIDGKKGKKQYDGSYSFTIDVKNKDITDYIWIYNYSQNFASFKSITIEYGENFMDFNYMSYKEAISNYIL